MKKKGVSKGFLSAGFPKGFPRRLTVHDCALSLSETARKMGTNYHELRKKREFDYRLLRSADLTIAVRPLRVDEPEPAAVWLNNGHRPDEQRIL